MLIFWQFIYLPIKLPFIGLIVFYFTSCQLRSSYIKVLFPHKLDTSIWYLSKWQLRTSNISNHRSSRLEVFCKKDVLRNFTKFTGKDLCQRLFFNTETVLAQVFSCEFCEISKNTFFYRTLLVAASTLCSFITKIPELLQCLKSAIYLIKFLERLTVL